MGTTRTLVRCPVCGSHRHEDVYDQDAALPEPAVMIVEYSGKNRIRWYERPVPYALFQKIVARVKAALEALEAE